MLISFYLKRNLTRILPFVWTNCKRCVRIMPRALFGTAIFSVNAMVDSLAKNNVMESMSNKSLIQNASSVTATSVNQLVVLSAAILIHHYENYRAALEEILLLMDRTLTFINSESHQEELWTEMVAARAKIDESKKTLIEMEGFMDYVEKLVTAAVEAAYMSGSDFSSTALCETFNQAQQKLHSEKSKTKDLESEYIRQQQEFIKTMGEKGKSVDSKE